MCVHLLFFIFFFFITGSILYLEKKRYINFLFNFWENALISSFSVMSASGSRSSAEKGRWLSFNLEQSLTLYKVSGMIAILSAAFPQWRSECLGCFELLMKGSISTSKKAKPAQSLQTAWPFHLFSILVFRFFPKPPLSAQMLGNGKPQEPGHS